MAHEYWQPKIADNDNSPEFKIIMNDKKVYRRNGVGATKRFVWRYYDLISHVMDGEERIEKEVFKDLI